MLFNKMKKKRKAKEGRAHETKAKPKKRTKMPHSGKVKGKQELWEQKQSHFIFHIIMYSDGLSNPLHNRVCVFHPTYSHSLNRLQMYEIYLHSHKWCTVE